MDVNCSYYGLLKFMIQKGFSEKGYRFRRFTPNHGCLIVKNSNVNDWSIMFFS